MTPRKVVDKAVIMTSADTLDTVIFEFLTKHLPVANLVKKSIVNKAGLACNLDDLSCLQRNENLFSVNFKIFIQAGAELGHAQGLV